MALAAAVLSAVTTPGRAVNYALDFQQLNDPYVKDHLRLSSHPAVGDEFTVEFWIRPDDSIPFCATEQDPQGCWSISDTWFNGNFVFDGHQNYEQNPGRDSFDVVLANSGRVKVVLDPGTTETDGATDVVTGGGWRHIAVVRAWTGTTDHEVRIYVDGSLDGQATYFGRDSLLLIFPYWGTERADWDGASPDGFPDYFGLVDEIRYWSVARTQAEIQSTMGTELVGNEPGLVHYLRLNEGQGALVHDMTSDNDGVFHELQPDSWVPSSAPIAQQPGPDCGDGIQNQGEQGVDCGGPCFPCPPATETACADGLDDDLDGATDCADGDCATDAACLPPAGTFPIQADDRDADHNPIEGVMLGNFYDRGQICIGADGTRSWQAGLQFRVTLPLPVTITEARLVLTSSGDNAGAFPTRIHTVDQDDMTPFVPGPGPPFTAAYPLTAESIEWTPPALGAGATARSPDLRRAVQDVVDRPGWQSGSHVGVILTEAQTPNDWRCYEDFFAGTGGAAVLELDFDDVGTPVCLDARGPADAFVVTREPGGGCPSGAPGPARDFVLGALEDLADAGGSIDLGPVRCAGGALGTTAPVVRSADPDPLPGAGRFYLWRLTGAADFGNGRLPDGSEPPRTPGPSIPCP